MCDIIMHVRLVTVQPLWTVMAIYMSHCRVNSCEYGSYSCLVNLGVGSMSINSVHTNHSACDTCMQWLAAWGIPWQDCVNPKQYS